MNGLLTTLTEVRPPWDLVVMDDQRGPRVSTAFGVEKMGQSIDKNISSAFPIFLCSLCRRRRQDPCWIFVSTSSKPSYPFRLSHHHRRGYPLLVFTSFHSLLCNWPDRLRPVFSHLFLIVVVWSIDLLCAFGKDAVPVLPVVIVWYLASKQAVQFSSDVQCTPQSYVSP
jgi:hypothetical protein